MYNNAKYIKGQEIKNSKGKSVVVVRPLSYGACVQNGGEVWAGTWRMTFQQLQDFAAT